MAMGNFVKILGMTLITSALLIVLGIFYFGISLWIIKIASNIFFGTGLEANWAVLSAALISVGAILAGSIERKS
jgi:hypothetical protein